MAHRVLIITYLFPPSGGVGPPRYAGYARHLPSHGFDVSVIAPKNPQTPLYDPALLKQVPPETHIHRVFAPAVPYVLRDRIWKKVSAEEGVKEAQSSTFKRMFKGGVQRFFNPDVQKFWVPFVIRRARKVIREEKVGTVILNIPPFSLFGVIAPLKREFPRLKWITEIRDDWLGYYLKFFDSARTDAKYRLAVQLEGEGMRASDFVVAVTPAQRDAMRNRYPDQPESKFLFLPNGFDADLYQDFSPSREQRQNVVIAYFGTLYNTPPYDISHFLEAADHLPDPLRSRLELRFIGRIALDAEAQLEGRTFKITKLGFYPRVEGVRLLQDTDYLLVPSNDPTAHAGKLFDYLATGLPIIALSPEDGEIAHLLEETGGGIAVDGGNTEAIGKLLLDAFQRLEGGTHRFPTPKPDRVALYERGNLVAKLVEMTRMGESPK